MTTRHRTMRALTSLIDLLAGSRCALNFAVQRVYLRSANDTLLDMEVLLVRPPQGYRCDHAAMLDLTMDIWRQCNTIVNDYADHLDARNFCHLWMTKEAAGNLKGRLEEEIDAAAREDN